MLDNHSAGWSSSGRRVRNRDRWSYQVARNPRRPAHGEPRSDEWARGLGSLRQPFGHAGRVSIQSRECQRQHFIHDEFLEVTNQIEPALCFAIRRCGTLPVVGKHVSSLELAWGGGLLFKTKTISVVLFYPPNAFCVELYEGRRCVYKYYIFALFFFRSSS